MHSRGSIIIKALFVMISVIGITCAAPKSLYAIGPNVREIALEGNIRTSSDSIRPKIKSLVGMPLNMEKVNNDIKSLYKLGQFRDIKVESEDVKGGVKLIYSFVEKPLIAEISFKGNRKLKDDDLRSEVVQRTFDVLSDKSVAESLQKIREAYAKKGYYLSEVDYHLERAEGTEDSNLVFDVHENKRVAVRRIMFMGNKVFSDDELRENVRTKQKGLLSFLTSSGKYDEEMLRNDALMLTYYYLNHGYLKVKVAPPKVTISEDKRYIFILFQVHEGDQYRIGDVNISGDILTTEEELAGLLKTKIGDVYSQRTLDGDLNQLTDRYGDEGYAYANIIPRTVPNDETLTADIDINIKKGHQITVERINISGNTVTRDKVIRRELEIFEDDRFSQSRMKASKARLEQLGFFEEVNFATPRGSRDDTMVLDIVVKEKSTGSFNIGAGFSSVESFIFNASVQKDNFFGYGISGNISTELSKKRQLFMLSMTDPYFLDTKWIAGMSVYRSAYSYTDFRRQSTGGEVNLGHRFFRNYTANLGYQIEQVEVSNFSYAVPQRFKQNTSGLTSALSLSFARDTRNNRVLATKGMYNILSNEVSGSKLGGDNDFYRINFRTMFYRPIWKSIIFKQFFKMGYIKSLDDDPVPLYERYFVGGVNSLRGYSPNSVGPTLRIPSSPSGKVEDFVYGGDKILLFVSEIEFPIYDKAGLRAVIFFDAGNTFAEQQNYAINNLKLDYGFGVRWNSPMGPLRFEWGIPINPRPTDDSVVFNFTIGNFF
jgi:outer membrane protein insertion porin family